MTSTPKRTLELRLIDLLHDRPDDWVLCGGISIVFDGKVQLYVRAWEYSKHSGLVQVRTVRDGSTVELKSKSLALAFKKVLDEAVGRKAETRAAAILEALR